MTASYSSTGSNHRSSSPSSSITSSNSGISTSPGHMSTQSSIPPPTTYTSQMVMQQGLPATARSTIRLVDSHDDSEDDCYIDPVQAYARVIYEHTRQQMDNTLTSSPEPRRSRNGSSASRNIDNNSNRQAGDRLSQHHYQQRERRAGSRTSGMA